MTKPLHPLKKRALRVIKKIKKAKKMTPVAVVLSLLLAFATAAFGCLLCQHFLPGGIPRDIGYVLSICVAFGAFFGGQRFIV
jgi:hypothetical protein